ncbi:GNAT family N-acetyltransferase [Brevibacillus borstelensis]|uniref:GNAT family N-acetyltransferase n=1 Tax=Brevibacillus borstelensis TaxID=45462 RepID=UPI00203AEBD2|nr:GNAT family N-acetyltransferase [Brevibacillus borstelensis]MCM3590188.1 GNAT family N-acetyltransferase [Brevibacillus borstelensis]
MEVRLFRRDETDLLQLSIDQLWAKNHVLSRDKQLLNYMFYDNPVSREIFGEDHYGFLGVWLDGRPIGLMGLMAFDLNVRGVKKFGFAPTNWIVPPEYRQTGAGLLLMREMFKWNPSVVLNLGINPNVARMYSGMGGYNVLPDVPRWIGLLQKNKTTELLLKGDESFLRYYREISAFSNPTSYRAIGEFNPERWDQCYWTTFAKRSNGFARDASFIDWRYLQHPSFTYQVYTCTDTKGDYQGLIVIRIENILGGQAKIGRLVEFIANNQDSAICLANQVVEIGKENELLFIDFYCFSSISSWGLESVGFKRVIKSESDKIVVPTRFQPIDLEVTHMMAALYVSKDLQKKISLIDDQSWYITKGDADQDRPN